MQSGKMYRIDFGAGKLVPLDESGPEFRIGEIVSYEDRANRLQQAVVVEKTAPDHWNVVFCEDYHRSQISKHYFNDNGGRASWQRTNSPDFAFDEVACLQIRAEQAVKEREETRRQAEADFSAAVEKLKADHPELIAGGGPVNAAKNIRIELKRAFPGVKFSVTTEKFSMGNSVSVSWTDGPTSKQVDKIVDKYSGGSFDGMTDCYNYSSTHWTEAFGSAKYTHTSRHYSAALVARAIAKLVEKYGDFNTPTVEDYENGRAWQSSPIKGAELHHDAWQSLITREAEETEG